MSTIKTERLVLRPLESSDAQAMYDNWTQDEHVARYCRWHPHESIGVTESLLSAYLEEAEKGFDHRWGITLSGKLIGVIDVVGESDHGKTAAVGYVLSRAYWNQGVMSEALGAVIPVLFSAGYEAVEAEHHVDNPASGRVMEKCGMRFVRQTKTQAKFGSQKLCDVKQYRIENPNQQ